MADKKKRGESGKANAESSPFRLNGGGAYPSHYRATMNLVEKMGNRIGRPIVGSAWDKPIPSIDC